MNLQTPDPTASSAERKLPPIEGICVAVLALVIIGGVYLASHLPAHISLIPSVALTSVAAVLVLVNMVFLSRIENFAWRSFFTVARWSFLAYLIIAGMLEFVFIYDRTRGSVLVLLSSTLAIFAINLPMLFGFSVARYQDR
jgi:hypothetical protein